MCGIDRNGLRLHEVRLFYLNVTRHWQPFLPHTLSHSFLVAMSQRRSTCHERPAPQPSSNQNPAFVEIRAAAGCAVMVRSCGMGNQGYTKQNRCLL